MKWSRIRSLLAKPAWKIGVVVAAAIGIGSYFLSYRYISTKGLDVSRADPASDYEAAIKKLAQLRAREDEAINPVCSTQLLSHGSKVGSVVVLLHGLTNCPKQYDEFAIRLHAQGYNVFIPLLPHHGLKDRMTDALKYLTAEELRDYSDKIIDIAHGLGERIIVAGLSAGGVIAAWIAQQRQDVALAVVIAPSLGLPLGSYMRLNAFATNVLLRLPNLLTQNIRPFEDGPAYAYLGYSTNALGQVMRLGVATYRGARKRKPAVQSILLVTNANDTAVNNFLAWGLVSQWRVKGLERFEAFEFKKEYGLIHDLVDPRQREQQIDLVYPILLDLIMKDERARVGS